MGPGLTLRENLPKIQWLGVNLMFPLHPFTERMDEAKPDTMLTCRFLEFVKRILKSKGGGYQSSVYLLGEDISCPPSQKDGKTLLGS